MPRIARYTLNTVALFSALLFAVAIAAWILSYRGVATVFWFNEHRRFEICSERGHLALATFHPWQKPDDVIYYAWDNNPDPGHLRDRWPLGIGWLPDRQAGALGFLLVSGSYVPPISWQHPRVPFLRCHIPYWFLIIAFTAYPVRRRLTRAGRRHLSQNVCLNCDYDLRATPDRCPECGKVTAPTATPR